MKFKKYVIMREHQFDFGAPIEIHYYTKDETTKNINEAKRFFTKKGAYKWLRKNYSRVENYFTNRYWFDLLNLNKEQNQKMTIKKCSNCKKQHTMDCPNSAECYATEDKPYFENKEIEEDFR